MRQKFLDYSLDEQKDQSIISIRKDLSYDSKDADLVVAIEKAMFESQDLREFIEKVRKHNKAYWQNGTTKDMSRWHPKKARVTSNRIFTDVETALPIITSEPPEPSIVGTQDINLQNNLKDGLKIAYEVKYHLQFSLQQLIRSWFLNRLGAWKYRWDKDKGFTTEVVQVRKLGFDRRATTKENCEYMWEEMECSFDDLGSRFSAKKKDLEMAYPNANPKDKVRYIEFWAEKGKWVCWKMRNIILDKTKNPNFNYPEDITQAVDPLTGMPIQQAEPVNLFDAPQFPYILFNVFQSGEETSLYDETSLIEEAAPLQEGVNQLEQQILDLNEGQKRLWVASSEAMSEQKAQGIVDKTGDLMVYLDRKMPQGGLQQVQSGKPDASLYNQLAHLLGEIDNVMGIHATTRGAADPKQETLGAKQLQAGADRGRLDLIVRNVEQVMEEWYNAYLQMILVYADEPIQLNDGKKSVTIDPAMLTPGLLVMVEKGSTLPIDNQRRMDNASYLAQAGMIDPQTLFEELQYSNPEERVKRLYEWLTITGKIQPQVQQMEGMEVKQLEQKRQQVQNMKQILQEATKRSPEEQTQIAAQIEQAALQIQ